MERKYKKRTPSKSIALIGDNFISQKINANFKRFSKLKTNAYNSVDEIIHYCDYIVDCTLDLKKQDALLSYAIKNNISKIILLTKKLRTIKNIDGLIIIQLITCDIYGEDHESFYREGVGNSDENVIEEKTLICEAIRRIHESKINCIPITYISYPSDNIKYMYVDNIYRSIEYASNMLNTNSYYEIADESKSVGCILGVIKEVIDYNGQVIHIDTNRGSKRTYRLLDDKHYTKPLEYNLRKIYKYISYTNDRFII